MTSEIKITYERLFNNEISPFIYGEFVEFINDLIPGMWAERIRDRAFEGLTNPRMFYRKEKDFPKPAWRELKFVNGPFGQFGIHDIADVIFDFDESNPFVGTRSARMRVGGTRNFMAGIAQDNIAVQKDEKLNFEIYLRSDKPSGKVHIFIGREYGAYADFYCHGSLEGIDTKWRKYTAELISPITDINATFAILLDKPGTLWIDKVSLMPSDNLGGWRKDVVEAVRALKPGIIRFGGSSLIWYDWRKGIGTRDKRVPFINTPWNNTEENDVGLDEFLNFCELVSAEPLLCVNSNSSTAEEVAQQVEYVNGDTKTDWGRRRAENGHPEPYNVKYWQIGNEQRGEEYERTLPRYIDAIKKAYPDAILLAAYPSEKIIMTLSSDLSYGCPHFYEPDMEKHKKYTDKVRARITSSPKNPDLKLGITEWSHTAGDWGTPRAWLQTLFNAVIAGRMLNHFQRNGDFIRIANRSNLVNSCFSGSIQTKPLDIYFTPTYHIQKLYSNLSGTIALKVISDDDCDVSATMDRDGDRIMFWCVNHKSDAIEKNIYLDGFSKPISVCSITLTGKYQWSVNSFERKDNVTPVECELEPADRIKMTFPAWSVTGMEFMMK